MNQFFKSETVLSDDYPIYGNYIYLADGKPIRSNYHGISAKEFKARIGAKELRKCDLLERDLL